MYRSPESLAFFQASGVNQEKYFSNLPPFILHDTISGETYHLQTSYPMFQIFHQVLIYLIGCSDLEKQKSCLLFFVYLYYTEYFWSVVMMYFVTLPSSSGSSTHNSLISTPVNSVINNGDIEPRTKSIPTQIIPLFIFCLSSGDFLDKTIFSKA